MSEVTNSTQGVTLDQKNIDILVANIIPTTKYFESRFDNLQLQLDMFNTGQQQIKTDIDSRFNTMKTDIDKRFEQVDKRFVEMKTDMDKRFEQVDKRFEQVDQKLDKILERIDRRIDEGLRENRAQAMRMFTFAMTFSAISMIGLIGKFLKLY